MFMILSKRESRFFTNLFFNDKFVLNLNFKCIADYLRIKIIFRVRRKLFSERYFEFSIHL